MQIILTVPLIVETALQGQLELLPVHMTSRPSTDPAKWSAFVKPQGQCIPLAPKEVERCKAYMRSHETEALSEDASTAFTIDGNALLECQPDVVDVDHQPED